MRVQGHGACCTWYTVSEDCYEFCILWTCRTTTPQLFHLDKTSFVVSRTLGNIFGSTFDDAK